MHMAFLVLPTAASRLISWACATVTKVAITVTEATANLDSVNNNLFIFRAQSSEIIRKKDYILESFTFLTQLDSPYYGFFFPIFTTVLTV
jgi:hypothetical protein